VKPFIAPRGLEELKTLRIKCDLKPTEGAAPIQLLARVPSDECGCPEELWLVDGILYLIHMEEDGTGEIFVFLGEDEIEHQYEAENLDGLRAAMFELHARMTEE